MDAHHILERRLWTDFGYRLDNGVALCARDHLRAERTLVSPEELRARANIIRVLVPDHLESDQAYDKWGNPILADGTRGRGELFFDESVQKALGAGHVLDLYRPYAKYPRTLHLPWSPGATNDDVKHKYLAWIRYADIVVTEKMDGENTTMYCDYIHARSLDGRNHPSRSWVKNLHGQIAHDIPEGWRICGENLQAVHSITYEGLPSYFLVYSIWNEKNECLSWDDTKEWCELLGLTTVPVRWGPGMWLEDTFPTYLQMNPFTASAYGPEIEGYVIRPAASFLLRDFQRVVGKYVRADHVTENSQHWFARQMVENGLESKKPAS